jgi:N-acetylneuraminic acid mutarotase
MPEPAITWWSGVAPMPYKPSNPNDPLVAENYSVGFSINNKCFVLGGVLFMQSGATEHIPDLWMFDPASQSWTKKAPYPGNDQNLINEAAFIIGDNAYFIVNTTVWQYNQPANKWTKKTSFPSSPRILGAAMAINGKGYFGLGFSTQFQVDLNDWWQYDPASDQWTFLTPFENGTRESAGTFVIGGKGYLCFGKTVSSSFKDLWQYDPVADTWTQKHSYTGNGGPVEAADSARINGVDLGLVAVDDALWEYNPSTNSWGTAGALKGGSTSAGFVLGHSFFVAGLSVAAFNWSK